MKALGEFLIYLVAGIGFAAFIVLLAAVAGHI